MMTPRAWGKDTSNDGSCEKNPDGRHSYEWWDAEGPCRSCGYDGELDNETGSAEPKKRERRR